MAKIKPKAKAWMAVVFTAVISLGFAVGCGKSRSNNGNGAVNPNVCPINHVPTGTGCLIICELRPAGSNQQCVSQSQAALGNTWTGGLIVDPGGTGLFQELLRNAGICDYPGTWSTQTNCYAWDDGGQVYFELQGSAFPTQAILVISLYTNQTYNPTAPPSQQLRFQGQVRVLNQGFEFAGVGSGYLGGTAITARVRQGNALSRTPTMEFYTGNGQSRFAYSQLNSQY